MNINGIIYYNRLKDGDNERSLLGEYRNFQSIVDNGVIVCRNFKKYKRYISIGENPDTGKNIRRYTLFKNHLDLYNNIMSLPEDDRSFFEIIQGHKPHKPHFDIDIEITDPDNMPDVHKIMSEILDAIIETMERNNVNLDLTKDVLIYSSSGANKASYHVVICNWKHIDNNDAKNLAKQVRLKFPSHIADYIDKSVYSSKQQFRLLHCSKLRTTRVKKPIKEWNTGKYNITYPTFNTAYDEFLYSLVSNNIGCSFLPKFYDPTGSITMDNDGNIIQADVKHDNEYGPGLELKNEDIKKCLEELYRKTEDVCGLQKNSTAVWNTFTVRSIERGFISLTKKRPYYCPICIRTHENENPYLTVSGSGHVRYYCRRDGSSIHICDITSTTLPTEDDETIEESPLTMVDDNIKILHAFKTAKFGRISKPPLISNRFGSRR